MRELAGHYSIRNMRSGRVAARGVRSSRQCSYAAVSLSLGEVRYLIHAS